MSMKEFSGEWELRTVHLHHLFDRSYRACSDRKDPHRLSVKTCMDEFFFDVACFSRFNACVEIDGLSWFKRKGSRKTRVRVEGAGCL